MMRVAVCDDNNVMLDFLVRQITEHMGIHSMTCEISRFESGSGFIHEHEAEPFDVVFLDIRMPDMNGFEVAKKIRALSENTYIVFITTEENLVYDSFDFRPFNFIPKGNSQVLRIKLDNVIGKLAEHVGENCPLCFTLAFGQKKYIEPADIICILSKSNYLDVICKTENIRIRGKINDIIGQLSPRHFTRIHNRCVVNLKHLCRIDNNRSKAVLDNGMEFDVSRSYKPALIERYNLFLRDRL